MPGWELAVLGQRARAGAAVLYQPAAVRVMLMGAGLAFHGLYIAAHSGFMGMACLYRTGRGVLRLGVPAGIVVRMGEGAGLALHKAAVLVVGVVTARSCGVGHAGEWEHARQHTQHSARASHRFCFFVFLMGGFHSFLWLGPFPAPDLCSF